jgi:hypothetical protein
MWSTWKTRWEAALAACERLGGDIHPLEIAPVATEQEVVVIEHALGYQLPISFRTILTMFSKRVSFAWCLPHDFALPYSLRNNFSGQCYWDIARLLDLEAERQGWITQVFPNHDDPYDRVWHQKVAFMALGNGDYLTIDLQAGNDGPVVYVSHDDGEGHGYAFGANFIDFVERWSQLGCPGGEDWQILPFVESPTSYIDPTSKNAVTWKEILNLQTI